MARPLVALVAALALPACTPPTPAPVTPQETARTPDAPNTVDYPAGPYGFVAKYQLDPQGALAMVDPMGSVIQNLEFVGQDDSNGNGVIDSGDAVKTIRLSDYYANKNIKVLFIGAAAGWCGPCKMEQPALVQLFQKYGGKNGKVAFLEAVTQQASEVNPKPADIEFIDSIWAANYQLPFTLVTDPNDNLGPYYIQNAIPMQLIVRTSDMRIFYQGNGTGAVADVVKEFSNLFDMAIAGQ